MRRILATLSTSLPAVMQRFATTLASQTD